MPLITEADWLRAKDIIQLHLSGTVGEQHRKLRLFGAACCRRAMALSPDGRLEKVVATAEEFADGLLPWTKARNVRRTLTAMRKKLGAKFHSPDEVRYNILDALECVTEQSPRGALRVPENVLYAFGAVSRPHYEDGLKRAARELVALAHEVFGNPFRKIKLTKSWRTSTVVALANQMYESRDFSAMPILADALQDAGCENDDILNHCREVPGVHVRGCWVVDLVLGKS